MFFRQKNEREIQKEHVKEVDSHHSWMNHFADDSKMMQTFSENPSREILIACDLC